MTNRNNQITAAIDEIFGLYNKYGQANYIGEKISQIEHMCQAAQLAEGLGHDDEVILAAFFHDIGHLVDPTPDDEHNMGGFGTKDHEKLGADYLRQKGFSEKIARLVESHVAAKRYLTYANVDYYNNLSEASKRTLEFQGGKMSKEEAGMFAADPLFDLFIQMRQWDEQAKLENIPLPDIGRYKVMAETHLAKALA